MITTLMFMSELPDKLHYHKILVIQLHKRFCGWLDKQTMLPVVVKHNFS